MTQNKRFMSDPLDEMNSNVPSRYLYFLLYALGASAILNILFGLSVCSLMWWGRPSKGGSAAAKSVDTRVTDRDGQDSKRAVRFLHGVSGLHHAGGSQY